MENNNEQKEMLIKENENLLNRVHQLEQIKNIYNTKVVDDFVDLFIDITNELIKRNNEIINSTER